MIVIKKKSNKYFGEYEGYKFSIVYSPNLGTAVVRWQLEDPKGFVEIKELEKEIIESYRKFVDEER